MKWIFWSMLLVNLGFATWRINYAAPAQAPSSTTVLPLPGHVNRLLLLSEFDESPLRERSGSASSATEETPGSESESDELMLARRAGLCLSVGPLVNLADVERVGVWLQSRGGQSTLREGERREISRFWVYFPPFPDRDAAVNRVEQMRRDLIDDIYVIPRGDMANAISLGLYSRRESLERRLQELRKKGYEPSIVPRYETQKASWFDVTFPAGITFSGEHFVATFPRVEATKTKCG